jgi:hypothetical protein
MLSKKRMTKTLLILSLVVFGFLSTVPPAEALPPRETSGLCWWCRFWPMLGLMCWTANSGRSDCTSYPSQPCWPQGAFCDVIIVTG